MFNIFGDVIDIQFKYTKNTNESFIIESHNNIIYHGSSKQNLKVLNPSISTHGKSYVYGTENEILATIFAAPNNLLTNDTIEIGAINNLLYISEIRKGAFNLVFNNKSGSIYKVSSKTFKNVEGIPSYEKVSDATISVIDEREIKNLSEELLKYFNKKLLYIKFYNNSNTVRPTFEELNDFYNGSPFINEDFHKDAESYREKKR
jgi:hypothetical protein